MASQSAVTQRPTLVQAWMDDRGVGDAEAMKAFMLARMLEWATETSAIPGLFHTYMTIVAHGVVERLTFATLAHKVTAAQCQRARDRCVTAMLLHSPDDACNFGPVCSYADLNILTVEQLQTEFMENSSWLANL